MAETDELKDDDQLSRSPSHHNEQGIDDHSDAPFPPGFPPFYGYAPDGAGGEGGSPPSGMPQFFPFPPGTPHALYQPFAANMPGGPLFPIPIGQLTGVGAFKQKRLQVKNACINCAQACKKCDNERPCERCKKYGIADSCVDSARKERKKGVKRGPYKRRLKSGATVTQEQDGTDGDWHPSHDQPETVDPSVLPSSTPGSAPTFGGPEGYYSYPYPYPLPPPGEGGPSNGEPGSFPPHFFPPGYPPYPHWQAPFGQGDLIGGPDEGSGQAEGSGGSGSASGTGGGANNGAGAGGSARTSGKKKRVAGSGASGKKSSQTHSNDPSKSLKRSSASAAAAASGGASNSKHSSSKSKKSKNHSRAPVGLMDISSVTDPSLLGDELAGMDPQIANA